MLSEVSGIVDKKILKLDTYTEGLVIDMGRPSAANDREERNADMLEAVCGEGPDLCLQFKEEHSESAMALKMALASRGFIQQKDFERGFGLWKK